MYKQLLTAIFFIGLAIAQPAEAQEPLPLAAEGTAKDRLLMVPTGSQVYYPTGTYYFTENDLKVAARSIPMTWERTYRSNRVPKKDGSWVFAEPQDGPLGFGWMTPWFVRIEGDAFVNREGKYFYFDKDANGNYITNMSAGLTLKKNINGYELLETGGNTYLFNTAGKLTSIKDTRGNAATLIYDTEGRLASIKDVMGRQIFTFGYNAANRIASVTDLANRTITYDYDPMGNLTKVLYQTQVLATYTYNSYHGMETKSNAITEIYTVKYLYPDRGIANKVLDPVGTELLKNNQPTTGHEMTFTYDFQNKVVYYTDYSGNTFKSIINDKGQLASLDEVQQGGQTVPKTKVEYLENRTTRRTDALGNSTYEQTDEWGNVIKKTDEAGYEWKYTYNAQSKMLSMTDPLGVVTKYEYDSYGNRKKEIVAVGTDEEATTAYDYNQYNEIISITKSNAVITFSYNDAGQKTEVRNQLNVTIMAYDTAGNLFKLIRLLSGETVYEEYDFRGNPGKVTDPNGNVTTYLYDTLGRLKTVTNQADSSVTTYTYVTTAGACKSCGGGGTGNVESITFPEGNRIGYDYDSAGSIVKITDNEGNTKNIAYDKRGNSKKEEIKDTLGTVQKTVSYEYNELSQLVRIINPDESYVLNNHYPKERKKTSKDPNGNVTQYFYDPLNRLEKTIQPGTITTTYSYDKRGNLKSVQDPNGNVTIYEYDNQNRLSKTTSPDTGITIYTYDLNSNLKTKKDAKGIVITYDYDAESRLPTILFPDPAQNITYTYDTCPNGKGRRCSMQDPSGTTSYEFNIKGQLVKETKVIAGSTYTTEYSYDKNGNTKTMKYPSGRVVTYQYSDDKVRGMLNNAATLASDIKYKPFGNIASLTYGNGLQQATTYDLQYRLSTLKTGPIQDLTYSYDYNGNITGITNNLDLTKNKTYTYHALDRLKDATGPWGTLNYTYDGVGNRKTETSNANETTYNYTANTANKLMSSAGAKAFSFSYDDNGNTLTEDMWQYIYDQNQRLMKVTESGATKGEYVYNGNGQRVKKTTASGAVIFHYDMQGQMIAESTAAGAISAEYVFLNGNPLAKIEGSSVYYYHNHHLGTPQKMTENTGTVVWYGEFLPFGELLSITGSLTNNLRFPGQYYDEEKGLHYNYFRDYNPVIGRYVEADPTGIEEGKNHLYSYGGNNPVNYMDPNGLLPLPKPCPFYCDTVTCHHYNCQKDYVKPTDRCKCHCEYSTADNCVEKCMDCFSERKPLSPKQACLCVCKSAELSNCGIVCKGVK